MTPWRAITLALALLVSAALTPDAIAAWIWSPQTGWVGPGGAVKDTPEEQLAFALEFFEEGDFDRAHGEFRKLLKAYEASREASEAQYYLGRCREEAGEYYKAFLEYRKAIQVYPSSARFDETLERIFRLGNAFLGGKKRKLLGAAAIIPARDKAVEIFQAIVDDGPFSKYGERAQYQLGRAYLAIQDYEAAVNAFEQLITRYPQSPLVDDARYQIAVSSLKGTFAPGYDQSPTDLAVRELEVFLREYPDSELSSEAADRLRTLTERRAEHDFQVAQFYEERSQFDAARLYYKSVVDRFPQTSWAPQAAARIEILNSGGR